jgi:uncharacterized surface protein with fasciclin (FAS1) repeats
MRHSTTAHTSVLRRCIRGAPVLGVVVLGLLTSCNTASRDDGASRTDTASFSTSPAAAPAPASSNTRGDLLETAHAVGTFTAFEKALAASGLTETLKGAGPFTILAPTDDAFAKIPAKDLDALLADKARLVALLKYHVIPGNVPSTQIGTLTEATTLDGRRVAIRVQEGRVLINDSSTVTSPDIVATNGVIHVINTVLSPPARTRKR